MADDFPLWLKSTVDKLVADKVTTLLDQYPTLKWAEVDDMGQTDEVFKSDEPALIWQFGTLYPHPSAPLYGFEFMVGAKTAADPGNYTLLALLGEIRSVFEKGNHFAVFDFTGDALDPASTVERGYLMVSSNEIDPQKFDRQSGIRYAVVSGKAVSYGA